MKTAANFYESVGYLQSVGQDVVHVNIVLSRLSFLILRLRIATNVDNT